MFLRLLRTVGLLLAAFCVGCGSTNSLHSIPQPQSGVAAVTAPLSAATSSTITGTATSCSSFYTCAYTITTSLGHGSATTSAQVRYQLPSQTKFTTSMTWTPKTLGHTGSTYHINGPFTAIDANTGKIVTGTTDDFIVQTQHCGRHGCYYTYALSNGTITFTLTNIDGTTTSVACNPASINSGGSTTCTVTVTDLANSSSFATGNVPFTTGTYSYGTFTPTSCALASGRCSVVFRPFDETVGGVGISASYPGDSSHYMSSGSTTIFVIGN